MSIPLTFIDRKLLDGAVHYTIMTTHGFMGRKLTTIASASGVSGFINWREKSFVINGVQRGWNSLKTRSGGVFSSEHTWNWGPRPFKLKYHDSHRELLATPSVGDSSDTVRFTTYHPHLFSDNERAVISFPQTMQESERMFVLMAILQTEIQRQDDRTYPGDAR
ncbi:hypothetical protein K438DRAFT_1784249 [Mycena galopus ATCC 62051]|nr:hypothetical protein K438DRAFT_1784249 [Mycena galopus ATCC 62051]